MRVKQPGSRPRTSVSDVKVPSNVKTLNAEVVKEDTQLQRHVRNDAGGIEGVTFKKK